ncbi:hypothetical protein Mp_2g22030 [Marchantia polymorpha subsp. ruderalis]|uniref:RIN4 pathogenic type III effector avirulence factor Avr cleavage site domain-containing protein n=1 Tax=Marchantia polymorpha TaxID=3197 RepID=A0A2R6X2M8_MARPO|nr:hypothetical protein MARPO_0040s0012 [Marchantia polymorpha]BBN03251.1 hypothetical protein Mp_2g22030 [Marchantia polymorpha subsp. ruderalis]|eukprot:PTQ40326.1 hypothetical protein MARPO_0040s0012 [Marchantia polymorpha]
MIHDQTRNFVQSRQAVQQFGAWRMDPHAPAVDYSQAFARARASQLGSMPPLEDKNEESFNQSTDSNSNDHVQNVDGLPMDGGCHHEILQVKFLQIYQNGLLARCPSQTILERQKPSRKSDSTF